MPNTSYISRLLWSTQGGGQFNSASPNIGGLGTAPPFAPPAASLNASGHSEIMDFSGYNELFLEVLLASFTGGTAPTFAPELDILDDNFAAGVWTPNAIPLWKPAGVSTATNWAVFVGRGQGAAPTITGFTVVSIPVGFANLGRLAWTVTGAPTAVTWTAFLYGKGRA